MTRPLRSALPDEQFFATLDAVYAASVEPDRWTDALRSITELFDAPVATLMFRHEKPSLAIEAYQYGLDAASVASYMQVWAADDPWMPHIASLPSGAIAASHALVPVDDLEQRPFHHQWLVPNGLASGMGLVLARDDTDGFVAGLNFFGRLEAPPVGREQLDALGRLAPHIRRAADVYIRFRATQMQLELNTAVLDRLQLAAFVIAPDGRVAFANDAARRLIAADDGIALAESRLVLANAHADRALRDCVASSLTATDGAQSRVGNAVLVPRRSGMRPLIAVVARLPESVIARGARPAGAVVVIRNPGAPADAAEDLLRRLFGLSAAEARLAVLVAHGRTPAEAATELGVSIHTVRTPVEERLREDRDHATGRSGAPGARGDGAGAGVKPRYVDHPFG